MEEEEFYAVRRRREGHHTRVVDEVNKGHHHERDFDVGSEIAGGCTMSICSTDRATISSA